MSWRAKRTVLSDVERTSASPSLRASKDAAGRWKAAWRCEARSATGMALRIPAESSARDRNARFAMGTTLARTGHPSKGSRRTILPSGHVFDSAQIRETRFRKALRRIAPSQEASAASSKSPAREAWHGDSQNGSLDASNWIRGTRAFLCRVLCLLASLRSAGFSGGHYQPHPPLWVRRRDGAHLHCQASRPGALQVPKYESAPAARLSRIDARRGGTPSPSALLRETIHFGSSADCKITGRPKLSLSK